MTADIKKLKEDAIKRDRTFKEANTQLSEHSKEVEAKDVFRGLHRNLSQS